MVAPAVLWGGRHGQRSLTNITTGFQDTSWTPRKLPGNEPTLDEYDSNGTTSQGSPLVLISVLFCFRFFVSRTVLMP
jgi:hypothetical protein